MNYLSVCSGIEAATVAWHPLGWRAVGYSEIEPFPSAVLAHHYPDVPNHGDFTTLLRNPPAGVDVLVGGTPCQAFSVAGLRGGLSDPRGNLALAFVALVGVLRPRWVVWENVPGVLSSGGGRDFGSFLGGLGELGYGWAYRVLDAQYFGLAQRRQRVFVVASPGDWRRAAAVLFEPEGVRRDSPPRRETRSGVAGASSAGSGIGRALRAKANCAHADDLETYVPCGGGEVEAFQCHGSNVGPMGTMRKGSGSVTGGVPFLACGLDGDVARSLNAHPSRSDLDTETFVAHAPVDLQNTTIGGDVAGTVDCSRPGRGGGRAVMAYNIHGANAHAKERHAYATEYARCLDSTGGFAPNQGGTVANAAQGVRRLMPHELERLQGFPDGYTLIPDQLRRPIEDDYAAWYMAHYPDATREEVERFSKDGPRAKALGNSMAVPVMRYIGNRIMLLEGVEACAHTGDGPKMSAE